MSEFLTLIGVVSFGGVMYFVGRMAELTKQREYLLKQLDEQVSNFKREVAKLHNLSLASKSLTDEAQKVAEQVQSEIAEEIGDDTDRADN